MRGVLKSCIDLHPLAIEDVLHKHGHARSKTDYYNQHLFIHVLSHMLGSSSQSEHSFIPEDEDPPPPRSSSPGSMTPGDYHEREYSNNNDVHDVEDEDRTMYGSSAPTTWRLGSTMRNRKPAKRDMESAEEKNGIPLTPFTRKESAVGFLNRILFSSSLCYPFLLCNMPLSTALFPFK